MQSQAKDGNEPPRERHGKRGRLFFSFALAFSLSHSLSTLARLNSRALLLATPRSCAARGSARRRPCCRGGWSTRAFGLDEGKKRAGKKEKKTKNCEGHFFFSPQLLVALTKNVERENEKKKRSIEREREENTFSLRSLFSPPCLLSYSADNRDRLLIH